ncbi:PREDICTED: uncharacterized protein C18orf63-like [Vollenhovia emeryi]|uniref:uncharacterized protein C18orf63-like n=1 Tax=Vollenhovia emeryi TaxID=411798 RepID=UPI0005F385B8|nr:PREDICTED: uncharacterized protein C18orf63-like [Vollenhovia emeryi]XP_011878446.1 PREDICTED: uncharacterized protein C18orf63-like [Vollenhovia emeryi]
MVSTAKIFNVTVPQKDDLCCAICKIVNSENNSIIYSNYCGNKLKCRQFLRETPHAMAAPIVNRKLLETGGSLYVIVAKDFFKSCTFRDHCDALNIQVMNLLDPMPTYVYKTCLLFTVEHKLAPQWNKVGLYLVEGRDFLSSTGSVNAITLNIKDIRDNSAQLQVEAVNLKIPFLRLNTTRSLQHDVQPPVRVLPSLKMANVLSTSTEIKENHLYKDYENLRAYWENMHGYILPDYKEGLLFYDIEFFYFKSSVFVYPETCLTSGLPEILPLVMDPVSRIYKFAGDLRGSVTKLCGQQLDVCPMDTYQAAVLACTPILSRVDRFSACDTGYGTRSRKSSSVTPLSRSFDTCDIPTKRSRLSLPKVNDSLAFKTDNETDDFNFGNGPTCTTSNFDKLLKTAGSISMALFNADSAVASKPIIQENESKSHYFKQESENKSFMELTDQEEKPGKQSLKEKLLKNF